MTNVAGIGERTLAIETELRDTEERALGALLGMCRMLEVVLDRAMEHPEDLPRVREHWAALRADLGAKRRAYDAAHTDRVQTLVIRQDNGADRALSIPAAADYTGLHRQTIHTQVRSGRIPSFTRTERGKAARYIYLRDLDDYLATRRPGLARKAAV